ncbi:DJ-1/PfpI family protein [uncultured Croceitalea sp.]|uniref:DJ-1/PfpI family protein n=1 Tax=uncultured Croceitalea sp. TaxID=1798908 RepID=UPI00330628E6
MKKIIGITIALCALLSCKEKMTPSNATEKEASSLTHDEIMETVQFKEHAIKSIGILVYEGVNSLDVFGPRYVLGQLMGAKTKLIAIRPGNVKTVMGIEFVPDATIAEVDSLDILVIPGGFRGTIETAYDNDIQQWIRDIDQTTTYTTSVCTGGWILGSTGLLKGKRATTNWYDAKHMMKKYGATFTNERFTKDGKYWTAAGVTAGMDMSLALLEEIAGRDYAQGVMLDMEYDPAPPFEGGSPEKTGTEVLKFMTTMYKSGIDPIIDEMERTKKSKAPKE